MTDKIDRIHDLAMLCVSEAVKHDPLLANPEQIAKLYHDAVIRIHHELKNLKRQNNT